MFVEVNDLSTIIVVPEGDALTSPELWQPFVERFRCAFVIDSTNMQRWRAWATTPNVYLVARGTLRYVNPVASYIKKSLEHFAVQPAEAVFISFSESSIRPAANTRVGTLLIGETPPTTVLPDIAVIDLDSALNVLARYYSGQSVGWFAEANCWAAGSSRIFREGHVWTSESPVGEDPALAGRVRLLAMGRYFASEDSRSEKHPLTKRILRAKSEQDSLLARCLASVLLWHETEVGFDLVTRVAPKPSRRDQDVLRWTIQEASKLVDQNRGAESLFEVRCRPDLLMCIREYGKQREAGGRDRRRQNVKGAFVCSTNLEGKRVVLVDDVYTTGETAAECSRMLLSAGASHVTVIVFGKDQKVVTTRATLLPCQQCGEALRYRVNRSKGDGFWGCSNYPRCKGTRRFDQGIKEWNSQHLRQQIDDIPDIDF